MYPYWWYNHQTTCISHVIRWIWHTVPIMSRGAHRDQMECVYWCLLRSRNRLLLLFLAALDVYCPTVYLCWWYNHKTTHIAHVISILITPRRTYCNHVQNVHWCPFRTNYNQFLVSPWWVKHAPESLVVNFDATSNIAVTDCSGVSGLPSHSGYPAWKRATYSPNISFWTSSAIYGAGCVSIG